MIFIRNFCNKFISLNTVILVLIIFITQANASSINATVSVKTVKVKLYQFFEEFKVIGEVRDSAARHYKAQSKGTIDVLSAEEGSAVKAGDLLIAIDRDITTSKLNSAKTLLKQATSNYKRAQKLFVQKNLSEVDYDKAKAELAKAEANFSEVQKNAEQMLVRAPFDGIIGVVAANVGDEVNIGDDLLTIMPVNSTSDKTVIIHLPEIMHNKVRQGDIAIIINDSGNKIQAVVSAVSPYLESDGTITAKLVIKDNDNNFIDASYVNVTLVINTHQGLGILEKAILKNDQGNFVYQIVSDKENNKVAKRLYLELGTRTADMMEIIPGKLQLDDEIVLEGLTKVQDGSSVTIIE